MPSYTVQKGDTLSGIAAKNGVAGGYGKITGYRSGNPNLIFPGEVVSWGAPAAAPQAAAPQAAAPAGPSAADNAAQETAAWQGKVNSGFNELGAFDQNAKNPLDIYNSALESLGITDARSNVTGLRKALLDTENLMKNVEGDVQGSLAQTYASEGQKRNLVAMEQQPLAERAASEGRNLEVALGDYNMIMSEGKAQTEMQYSFQKDQRVAMMDRLELAIGQAKNSEDKRRYETDLARLKAKDAQEQSNWERDFGIKQQELAIKQQSANTASKNASSKSNPAADAVKSIASSMAQNAGDDGKVSPGTYNSLKNQYVSGGFGTYDQFHKQFWNFANDKHWWDYK